MYLKEAIEIRQCEMKLSNLALAEITGMHRHTVKAVKNGYSSHENVKIICEALNIKIDFKIIYTLKDE